MIQAPTDTTPIHGLQAFAGGNFSGRTRYLRAVSGLDSSTAFRDMPFGTTAFTYVPPEVHSAVSGLASTVDAELALHGITKGSQGHTLAETMGLLSMGAQSPFDLSGGQQSQLVVLTAFGLKTQGLALDCCLEQIDAGLRDRLLDGLSTPIDPRALLLADNRLKEYGFQPITLPIPTALSGCQQSAPNSLTPLGEKAPMGPALNMAEDLLVEGLTFQYRQGAEVLRHLDAHLHSGTIYVLEGSNGSGKSTLAKLLSGVLRPKSGKIRLGGRPVDPWRQPGRTAGYHFQSPDLQLFAPTVADEIMISTLHLGLDEATRTQRVEACIDTFGLGNVTRLHPLDLPFAGRKRVALAATFAMGSPWLILDEPTLGQDDVTMAVLGRLIQSYASKGGGVIVITHSSGFKNLVDGCRLSLQGGRLV